MASTDGRPGRKSAQAADQRDAPLVSAIVPTYGRDVSQLDEAIESIRRQTYDPLELVVVDDSPGVASAALVDGDDVQRVKLVSGGTHDGAAAARNTGIDHAQGRFLSFLDDDDTWHPEKTARQVAALRAAPDDVRVAYTALEYVREGRVIRKGTATTSGDVTEALLRGASLGTFSTLMVDQSLLPRAGRIDERFPVLEDREWCLRLSRHARFAAVDEPLVRYRKGDYEQLTDDYESLCDVAVPLFEHKHLDIARAHGRACARAFRGSLRRTCAASALSSGRYHEARRHAVRALRFHPADRRAWMYLAAAAGGRYTHRPLRLARRHALLLVRGIQGR